MTQPKRPMIELNGAFTPKLASELVQVINAAGGAAEISDEDPRMYRHNLSLDDLMAAIELADELYPFAR